MRRRFRRLSSVRIALAPLVIAHLSSAAATATAQTDTLQTVQRATALIRSQQYEAAIVVLEAITEQIGRAHV